jgi:hypothetical protein
MLIKRRIGAKFTQKKSELKRDRSAGEKPEEFFAFWHRSRSFAGEIFTKFLTRFSRGRRKKGLIR